MGSGRVILVAVALAPWGGGGEASAQAFRHQHFGDCFPRLIEAADDGGAFAVGEDSEYRRCVVRLRADGSVAWQRKYDDPSLANERALDAAPDGGACLLDQRGIVTRLTPDGIAAWSVGVSRASYDNDVAATKDGGCTVVGIACALETPGFAVRIGRNGIVEWRRALRTCTGTTTGSQGLHAVTALPDDDVLVAGQFNDDVWDTGTLFVARLDPAGGTRWMRRLADCPQGMGSVRGIAASPDGTVIVSARIGGVESDGSRCVTEQLLEISALDGSGRSRRILSECAGAAPPSLPQAVGGLAFADDGSALAVGLDSTGKPNALWRFDAAQASGIRLQGVRSASMMRDGAWDVSGASWFGAAFQVARRSPDGFDGCATGRELSADSAAEPFETTAYALDDVTDLLVILSPGTPRSIPRTAGWSATCAAGGPLEPSALDLRAAAPALRVAKLPDGALLATWEDVGGDADRLHEGTIGPRGWHLTSTLACDVPEPRAVVRTAATFAAFVATSVTGGVESSLGRTSLGWEREGSEDCR